MEKLNLIIENFYNFQGSVELGLVFNVKLLLPYVNPSDYRDAIVKSGNLDILNLWLADHRVTALGQAMTVAIDAGYSNIVSRLLQDPRIAPSFYSNKRWICQAARGHIDIVNALLEDTRINPSVYNQLALLNAVKEGRLDIVERLLEDPRVEAEHGIMRTAMEMGYWSIFDKLWKNEKTSPCNLSKIMTSIERVDILDEMLRDGRGDPSVPPNRTLKTACVYGRVDIVKRLLEDPRINPADIVNSVLIKTIVMGQLNQLAVIDKLLEDTRVVRAGLHRAIQLATQNSQLEIVERLERALREE